LVFSAAANADEIRGPVPPRARWKDGMLWVPRIIVFPLRLIFLGLSYPVRAGARLDERHQIHEHIYHAITWNDGQIGIRPAFSFSLLQTPTFGLSFFDRRSMGRGTSLTGDFVIGSANVIHTETRVAPVPAWRVARPVFDLVYDRRNDRLYTGLGNRAPQPPGALGFARYSGDYVDVRAGVALRAARWLDFVGGGTFGFRRYDNGKQFNNEPPINQVYCIPGLPQCNIVDDALVPGFHQGSQFLRGWAGLRVDTRDFAPYPRTGVLLDLTGDYTHGIADDPTSYLRWHGSFGVAIDLWQRARTLFLHVRADDVQPIGDSIVPFSELAVLGGPEDLRGFRIDQFRDYSSLVLSGEYRWPIWMWMDAVLFADYGGVAGQAWKGLNASQLQPDVGFGLRFHASSGFLMRIELAYGFGSGWTFYISGHGP
jgi:hypothetical protein